MMSAIYEMSVTTLQGDEVKMSDFAGQVLLIVNVASHCGFTPQYADLQKLYADYRERGVVVLGFPCNQFGGQEPAANAEIGEFCQKNYGVDFPMFAKIDVNGANTPPLYRFLKREQRGIFWTQSIKWNFTKFLVDRHGRVIRRYSPKTKITDLLNDIEELL